MIVAGSAGMTGAAVLASRGALRSGAGLTYLAVPKDLVNFVDLMTPEVITLPFDNIKNVKADVIAIGPGLGAAHQTKKLVASIIPHSSSLILDADALNVLASDLSLLKKTKAETEIIITPHPGELSRLIKKDIEYIQKNRLSVAKETAKRFNCVTVLKGHKTVVAEPSGMVFINETGNPGMATGGAGDVLTGMIAAFKAQGMSAWRAAVTGVSIHGLAGDLAAKEKGEYGIIASDLVEKIPYAIQKNS